MPGVGSPILESPTFPPSLRYSSRPQNRSGDRGLSPEDIEMRTAAAHAAVAVAHIGTATCMLLILLWFFLLTG